MKLPCILAITSLAAASTFATAATPTPATWSVQGPAKAVAPGSTFALRLTAAIQPGWHLYALEEPDGGPLPTVIGLSEGDPLTLLDVTEPDPHKVLDPVTSAIAGMFTNSVSFTLKVRAPRSKPAPEAVSHVLVRYQTCNDHVCLPPHTETVALPLANLLR